MSPDVVTFGCRLNGYESEAIRRHAAGLADAVIINSCAVTAEAVRQARQEIRRLRRQRPSAHIIVTGCAAQTAAADFAAMPEVDRVLGNAEKLKPESYGPDAPRVQVGDIMAARALTPQPVDSHDGHTRAFLAVQNGCDHRCTFCVIPFGRGPSRSLGMGACVAEARRLAARGFAEIVLTGVDLTAYGADLPGAPGLGDLVRKILKLVPDLKRLRLSSLDSVEVDEALLDAVAHEERLMPHFHLSVQSGDDLILKRMKRRHSRADTLAFCSQVRRLRPDTAFSADLIAGFPTESETMFRNSLALVEEAGLSGLHVFPFSARSGTPAARMPQLPRALVKERAARLRTLGAAVQARHLAGLVGTRQEILLERGQIGRTRCFAPVRFAAPAGSFHTVTIAAAGPGHLIAEAA